MHRLLPGSGFVRNGSLQIVPNGSDNHGERENQGRGIGPGKSYQRRPHVGWPTTNNMSTLSNDNKNAIIQGEG